MSSDAFADVAALPGVDAAVRDARKRVDTLLRHGVLRKRSTEVSSAALLRSARATVALGALDGTGGTSLVNDQDEEQAAVRAYAQIGPLEPAWTATPRQALARVHVLAARGLHPDEALGRPRDDLPGAMPAVEVSARLDGLVRLLLAPTVAPALVVAAVVHGELLALRVFGSQDGTVARVASRFVLVGRALDAKALTVPEEGHLAGGYLEAFEGYHSGTVAGVAAWVVHCARAVGLGAEVGVELCEVVQRA